MTRVRDLRPRPVASPPTCCAEISDPASREYRQHRTPGNLICQRVASVEIDGRPYCGQHAGTVALTILRREK